MRARARDRCQALNATREGEQDERRRILRDLFGVYPAFMSRAVPWLPGDCE